MSKRQLDNQPGKRESFVDKKVRTTTKEPDSELAPPTINKPEPTLIKSANQVQPESKSKSKSKPKPERKSKRSAFFTIPREIRQQIILEYLIPDGNKYHQDEDITEYYVDDFIERCIGETVNEHGDDVYHMAHEEYHKPMEDAAIKLKHAYDPANDLYSEIDYCLHEAKSMYEFDYDVAVEVIERWKDDTFEEWYKKNFRPYSEEEDEEPEDEDEGEDDDGGNEEEQDSRKQTMKTRQETGIELCQGEVCSRRQDMLHVVGNVQVAWHEPRPGLSVEKPDALESSIENIEIIPGQSRCTGNVGAFNQFVGQRRQSQSNSSKSGGRPKPSVQMADFQSRQVLGLCNSVDEHGYSSVTASQRIAFRVHVTDLRVFFVFFHGVNSYE
ncbi:hypothetical protein FKW77_005139 [Venturia effusa]|uniref:Uncharacterized protein n=1 Tax=Venturia effusa TaxID=50376 RepID=A0A517L989_9PEZI|nr:hypothetical protein FKW77_005139 [Venturia effusa]